MPENHEEQTWNPNHKDKFTYYWKLVVTPFTGGLSFISTYMYPLVVKLSKSNEKYTGEIKILFKTLLWSEKRKTHIDTVANELWGQWDFEI